MILVLVVEDWRSALTEHGGQSVEASLDSLMPQLCAGNWRDSLLKASFAYCGLDSVHVRTSTKGTMGTINVTMIKVCASVSWQQTYTRTSEIYYCWLVCKCMHK